MNVSSTMQRYAAEIYRLQQDHEQVPLSLLSSHVDSSAQAISSMVKRLQKLGYLVHEPYRGVRPGYAHRGRMRQLWLDGRQGPAASRPLKRG